MDTWCLPQRAPWHLHFVLPAFAASSGSCGCGGDELRELGQGVGQRPHVSHHGRGLPPGLGRLLLFGLFDGADLWEEEEREGELQPSSTQQLEVKRDWVSAKGDRSPSAAHGSIYSKMSVWSVEQFKGLLRWGTFYSLMLVFYHQAHGRSLSSGWKHTHSTFITQTVDYNYSHMSMSLDQQYTGLRKCPAWQKEMIHLEKHMDTKKTENQVWCVLIQYRQSMSSIWF